ncbi:flavin reductase family protein [Hydrogenophaga sp.]|uniref:flavin reductase family protein n=1 Tax=Hydrogenophaga sp. TaxID=1904254 RepID=UPI0027219C02|nr:flavin reductase family protein [Hydrogenophaga sp.]MDO9438088.1 flavin reductase family protein [Hydrogenophaga sp.]
MSQPGYTTLDATTMDTATAYRLLVGAVVPRPVAWITTRSKDGVVNAAPFSSYNYVAHSPPMVAVNIGTRDGELKDTARNIVETGEFVVNVATFDAMDLMHGCSAEYPSETSEVDALGIELIPGERIAVPRVAVSPIQMECRLERAITLGRGLNTLYIGEVLVFHLSSTVFDGRYIDSVKMRPISRLGGPLYAELGELHTRAQLQKPPK